MHWSRWGDPALAGPVSPGLRELVEAFLGPARDRPAVSHDDVEVPDPALPEELLAGLRRLLPAGHVRTDREARLEHTRGRSTSDLLRIRSGDASDAPDAVVRPGGHDEVASVVSWCSSHAVGVVPFGGGTSVVGGLTPSRSGLSGVVALDLRRLRRLLEVDPVSRTAELEAGLRGPEAESLLAEHGLRLGHTPQSFEYATLGGFAATRSSGQASAGYGRFDEMVTSLRVATPVGDWSVGTAPASAAGPDLRHLVLGSEGALGVVTELGVRVRPLPDTTAYEGWRLPSWAEGLEAVRALAQRGPRPTVLRLSDEAETAVNLADPGEVGGAPSAGGCLLVTGYEGAGADVDQGRRGVAQVLGGLGATPLGEGPGRAWAEGRFSGPYLRDSLLDIGVLVETLETATYWSNLARLYAAVKTAVERDLSDQGTPPLVLCHVSHVYETGASLYLTVAARETDDPVGQWRRAKAAALDAVVATGGTLSHHHGVGRDHLAWLEAEIGPVGIEVLRAVKHRLDPNGVMNPGVLVP
jgi:alkyldihydroxyacetonephosphate synthase